MQVWKLIKEWEKYMKEKRKQRKITKKKIKKKRSQRRARKEKGSKFSSFLSPEAAERQNNHTHKKIMSASCRFSDEKQRHKNSDHIQKERAKEKKRNKEGGVKGTKQ